MSALVNAPAASARMHVMLPTVTNARLPAARCLGSSFSHLRSSHVVLRTNNTPAVLTHGFRVTPPRASMSWLEKLDSPEGNFDESDFEADEDDLPPLNERQVVKLEAAFNKGKSSYSVKKLAGEVNLNREDVILWMKVRKTKPSLGKTFTASRSKRFDSGAKSSDSFPAGAAARGAGGAGASPPRNSQEQTRMHQGRPYQWWNQDNFANRKINKSTLATLHKVFSEERFPSDEIIADIAKQTKLPRKRVLNWFKEQRTGAMVEKHGYRKSRNDSEYDDLYNNDEPTRKPKRRWY